MYLNNNKPNRTSPESQSQTTANIIYCRYCGELRPITNEFCSLCGRSSTASSTSMKNCTVCEANMSEDSTYCANCGAKFESAKIESKTGSAISLSSEKKETFSPYLTFEDAKTGIKLQYPSDWNMKVGHDMVIFSPKGERYRDESSGLGLMGDKTYGKSLGEYAQEKVEAIRNEFKGVKILQSSNTATLSGRPAYRLDYLRRSSDGTFLVRRIEIGTIVGNRVYLVNSGSEAKYYSEISPTLERMISTFEFTPNEAPLDESQNLQTTSMSVYCRYCGKKRPITFDSCPLCGRSLTTSSSAMKQCIVCDASMSEDSLFCANCGAKSERPATYSATGIIGGGKKSLPSFLRSTKGISIMGTTVLAAVIIFLLINQFVVAPAECAKEKDRLEKERVRMWPDATTEQWASWGDDLEQYRNQCEPDWEPT
jgi:Double zinc ribbon